MKSNIVSYYIMKPSRVIPPAAAPLKWKNIVNGMLGTFRKNHEIQRFERELKEYFESKHCFLVSSGKAALTVILLALRQICPERTEVLIPAFTCFSVPSAIVRAGLEIELCDISKTGFDFDHDDIKKLLSDEKLLCVVPTHLFGIPADVVKLRSLLDQPQVTLVEDAAQSMGGFWQGQKLGKLGDVSFFSLGRGKAFSTVEGGIILTDRDDIAKEIQQIVSQLPSYNLRERLLLLTYAVALKVLVHPLMFWLPRSLPFLKLGETLYDPGFKIRKFTNFQAGLTTGWQSQLSEFRISRKKNTSFLSDNTHNHKVMQLVPNGKDLPDLLRFPIKASSRKVRHRILNAADQQGLGFAEGYPSSINHIAQLKSKFENQTFPCADSMAQLLITLPVHPYLTEIDLNRIKTQMDLN